jgi:flagellar biosynthetic protein FliQ
MTEAYILNLAQNTLVVSLTLAGPVLLASLVIGSLVSLFQAATQINEATLTFVPKMAAVVVLLVVMGSWMAQQLLTFTTNLFSSLATLPR